MDHVLSIWVVYDHPTDYPNDFVARRFENDQPTSSVMFSDRLETLRECFLVQMGLTCIERDPSDDPKIVESWL